MHHDVCYIIMCFYNQRRLYEEIVRDTFISALIFLLASFQFCKKGDKPVDTQNNAVEVKNVTVLPAVSSMEQVLLAFNKIDIRFKRDQLEGSDSDAA